MRFSKDEGKLTQVGRKKTGGGEKGGTLREGGEGGGEGAKNME